MKFVQRVRLLRKIADRDEDAMLGKLMTAVDFPIVLSGDADVFRADGRPLLLMRCGAISESVASRAYEPLHWMRDLYTSNNRGTYAGLEKQKNGEYPAVRSAIVGHVDRQGGRWPFCRTTAFTAEQTEKWLDVVPLAKEADAIFKRELPERHAAQIAHARRARPEFIIKRTAFSTLTVNNNVVGRCHRDAGDLPEGFGLISCFRRGAYTGGLLGFPSFGVAVDLRDRDVVLFDPHELHAVTPIEHVDPANEGERITVVYYLRKRITDCLEPSAERERAKSKAVVT